MDQVGLKFLFGSSLFFAVLVTKPKASEIMNLFRMKSDAVVYDDSNTWAIRLSDVACVHVIDPREIQPQHQGPPGVPGGKPIGFSSN